MIEGRSTVTTPLMPVAQTSSFGPLEARNTQALTKSDDDKVTKPEVVQDSTVTRIKNDNVSDKLDGAVASINDYVQSVQRDIHFSIDDDLQQTVVKVIDSDSGELIRQIPGEIFLEMARKLREGGDFRMVDATG